MVQLREWLMKESLPLGLWEIAIVKLGQAALFIYGTLDQVHFEEETGKPVEHKKFGLEG